MTATALDFTWRGTITGLHDGDTVWIDYADMGAGHRWYPLSGTHWLIRLAGIAARELADDGGKEAAANLATLLPVGTKVWLRTVKPDHYGNRLDAYLHLPDGTNVNDKLVADGWALPWNGQGTQPKPAWPRLVQQGVGYVRAATEWKVGA